MSSGRRLLVVCALITLFSSAASCVLAAVSVSGNAGPHAELVSVVSAVMPVSGLIACATALWSTHGRRNVVVVVSGGVTVVSESILTNNALGIIGQPFIGYVGIVSSIAVVVAVVAEVVDHHPRADTSDYKRLTR